MVNRRSRPLGLLIPALAVVLAATVLAGCAAPRQQADALAAGRNLVPTVVAAGKFDLYTAAPPRFTPGAPLSVYIEGDGFAWRSRYRLSEDPTPRDPIALRLAAADPGPNVVYIARPCQYVGGVAGRNCHPAYWSSARYGEDVLAAMDAVIQRHLAASGGKAVRLIGYSGGGALAVLLAVRRPDTAAVVTVAGVLDTDAWTRLDGSSPLLHSLNPADVAEQMAAIPQTHLVGAEDRVVPRAVADSFMRRLPVRHRATLTLVSGQDHECCWVGKWRSLLAGTGPP